MSTRKLPRLTSRLSARACARRMTNVTLARVHLIFTLPPASFNAFFPAYSCDEKDEKFICELFVEIIDIDIWKEDCDKGKDDKDHKDGKKDDKKDNRKKDDKKEDRKYYDTSAWNAHYRY
ncbi:hypothetical protein EDD18DRAFT_1356968 [Armillaria luteobubalina]|uniref:Uncharacterized protein n=1 Tax=Armillaria luteobubalina TaxID=153913 RepID=A0AA39TKL6_9AGAR|nr:hypothetical protein EDD18DRAFT_1356968 [Armillaria luteobubalina]